MNVGSNCGMVCQSMSTNQLPYLLRVIYAKADLKECTIKASTAVPYISCFNKVIVVY